MNSRGTAFFIEPTGTLLDALRENKRRLERQMPGQAYTSHPPHCTLLFGEFGAAEWLETARRRVGALTEFDMETNAWQLFANDMLADGGTTIAYRAALTPPLAELQRTLAECIAPFRSKDPAPVAHPLAKQEPFASSLCAFGFPFVGAHWIPHFTIGSPQVPADSPLVSQLTAGTPQHAFKVRSVSVWVVDGDRHERVHELALANRNLLNSPDGEKG